MTWLALWHCLLILAFFGVSVVVRKRSLWIAVRIEAIWGSEAIVSELFFTLEVSLIEQLAGKGWTVSAPSLSKLKIVINCISSQLIWLCANNLQYCFWRISFLKSILAHWLWRDSSSLDFTFTVSQSLSPFVVRVYTASCRYSLVH